MPHEFTPEARKRLAAIARVDPAYLYQCLTGRRDMGPVEARRVESETGRELQRWDLCQATWGSIWPELMAEEGAPSFAETKAHAESMRPSKPDREVA